MMICASITLMHVDVHVFTCHSWKRPTEDNAIQMEVERMQMRNHVFAEVRSV